MTTIESKKVFLPKSRKEVFDFLSDLNNHKQILPDNIKNWSINGDECSFTIQNMITLTVRIEREEPSRISLIPKSGSPVAAELKWILDEAEGGSYARMVVNADLNPFIKPMAAGILTPLVNQQADKLAAFLS